MFNSPINPLFSVTPAGQEGRQGRQEKEETNQNSEKDKNAHKNIFSDTDEPVLYTGIIEESFNIELYIKNYFERLKSEFCNAPEKVIKIDKFLQKFDIDKFMRKYGKELSKEDLNVILYEKVIELGLVSAELQ